MVTNSSQNITTVEAIVLRAFPSRESDLVLKLLTKEEGKIAALARGSRRGKSKVGVQFDIFDCGNFQLKSGKGTLAFVSSFSSTMALHHLREKLERIAAATLLSEAFDLLVLEGDHEGAGLFEPFKESLRKLQNQDDTKAILKILFETLLHLLTYTGFVDPAQYPQPSRNSLLRLIEEVENHAERKLESKGLLFQVLHELKV